MPPGDPASPARLARDHVLVLAAGQGRRMGCPKALMLVKGRPWWRWQHEALAEAGLGATWAVSPVVKAAIGSGPGAPRQVLADDAAPMFQSLRVGVESLARRADPPEPPRGLFVLPIDVPVPARAVWSALAAAAVNGQGVAAPSFQGAHGHPLYMTWAWAAEHVLAARSEDARLDRLISGVVEYIDVDDPSVAHNLNTPADVAQWLARRDHA